MWNPLSWFRRPTPTPPSTTPTLRGVSDLFRRELEEAEGRRAQMYRDVANKPTIGIGHLLTAKELSTGTVRIGADDVPWADGLSDVQIDALLDQDLLWARRVVSEAFTFNVGPGHFRSSTLVKKLNAGDYQAVPDQLRRWVYAGGKEVQGLKNRREMEIRLWRTVT